MTLEYMKLDEVAHLVYRRLAYAFINCLFLIVPRSLILVTLVLVPSSQRLLSFFILYLHS